MLFLHGLAGSARNWRGAMRALRPSHRAIAFDARGHARSEAPSDPGAYGLEVALGDALGVLAEHAGAGVPAQHAGAGVPAQHAGAGVPAIWVCLSMGAVVALEAALRRPAAVRGLLLASYPGGRDPSAIAAAAERFADAIEGEGLEVAGAQFAWGPGSGLDEGGARLVRQGFLEHPAHALAHTLRRLLGPRRPPAALRRELRALRLPVAVVAGERDPASLPVSRELAAGIPGATLDIVPGAGHVVNLAARDAFDAALRDLLARIEHTPAPARPHGEGPG